MSDTISFMEIRHHADYHKPIPCSVEQESGGVSINIGDSSTVFIELDDNGAPVVYVWDDPEDESFSHKIPITI